MAKQKLGFKNNFDRQIYRYKQYCDTAQLSYNAITTTVNADTMYAFQFTLEMIPQYTTFAALYDQYRIDSIELTVRPRADIRVSLGTAQGNVTINNFLSSLLIAIDNDDATTPTSYNALRQYGNAKEHEVRDGKKIVKVFKPAVAALIYNGIVAATGERFSPWIDIGNTAVPHYGIKMGFPACNLTNLITCDITARYILSFKQVR